VEKFYKDKKQFLAFALKLLCKTPNESVVESMGSVAELHAKPQRNNMLNLFATEVFIDWNGPSLPKATGLIERALDHHF